MLHGRVRDLADMVEFSRRTMANIRQNISVALGLRAVFLVTTVIGVTGIWPLADTGATVLVTANAMRCWAGGARPAPTEFPSGSARPGAETLAEKSEPPIRDSPNPSVPPLGSRAARFGALQLWCSEDTKRGLRLVGCCATEQR